MNVVCGTDFSDDAKAGATVAATLAGRLRDRLLLVHALPGGGLSASSPEAMSSLFANRSEKPAEEGARLAQLGAEVEPHRTAPFSARSSGADAAGGDGFDCLR